MNSQLWFSLLVQNYKLSVKILFSSRGFLLHQHNNILPFLEPLSERIVGQVELKY